MEHLVDGAEAPAAGAVAVEECREETGRVEAGRRGVEEKENGGCAGDHEGGQYPADASPRCLSEASSRAKEAGCRPRDVGIPVCERRSGRIGVRGTHMIAVGGAGSSAAPAFFRGTRTR